MEDNSATIPPLRSDGYLPEGVHPATEAEITFRFGAPTKRRRRLTLRLRRWIELCRQVGARRFVVDGSFVTAKPNPDDLDAVVLLPENFEQRVLESHEPALELEEMLVTHRPEEIYAAEDDTDWLEWVEFFSRTRELEERRKGLVEVIL